MDNPWGTSHEPDPWAAPTSSSISTSSPGFGTQDDAEVDISAHTSHNDDWEPPQWNKDETYDDENIYTGSSARGFDSGFSTGGSGMWGSAAAGDEGGWGAETYAGIDLGGTNTNVEKYDTGFGGDTGLQEVDEDVGGARTPTPTIATKALTFDNPFATPSSPFETSFTNNDEYNAESTFTTPRPVFDDPSPFSQPDSPRVVDLKLNLSVDDTPEQDQGHFPDIQDPDEDGFGVFAHTRSPSFPTDHDTSWPSATMPPPPSDDSPWGQDAWSSSAGARNAPGEEDTEDEWTAAQRAQVARDARVPPEVRAALVAKAEEVVATIWPLRSNNPTAVRIKAEKNSESDVDEGNDDDPDAEEDEQAVDAETTGPTDMPDMPRSLEDIPAINTLRMRLVPYDPPVPLTIIHFPQTHASKALANTLRHTRNLPIVRHSPLAHFLASASRGSASWEASVRAPRPFSSSTDPHHDPEHEAAVPAGWRILEKKVEEIPTKQPEKKTGFLANWLGRRTSSVPNEAARTPSPGITAESGMKSPSLVASTSSPRTSISTRMSVDFTAKPPTPVSVPAATTGSASTSRTSTPAPTAPTYSNGPDFFTPEDLIPPPDPTQQQPASAVSRFLGRFRQTPQKKDALANMSTDDLDILGDITPASSSGPAGFSPLSSGGIGPGMTFDGLDAMIRSEKIMTGPLPPVLAPPPRAGSTSATTSRGATPVVSPVSAGATETGFGGLAGLAAFDSIGGLEKTKGGMIVPLPTRKATAKPHTYAIKTTPILAKPLAKSTIAAASTMTTNMMNVVPDEFGEFGFGEPAASGAAVASADDDFGDFGDFGVTNHNTGVADAFDDFTSASSPSNVLLQASKAAPDLGAREGTNRLLQAGAITATQGLSPSPSSGMSTNSPAFPAFNAFTDSSGTNLLPNSDSRSSVAANNSSSSFTSFEGLIPSTLLSSSRSVGMSLRGPGLDMDHVGMGSTHETDSPVLRSPSPPKVPAKVVASSTTMRQTPGPAPIPGRLTPALAPIPAAASALDPLQVATPPPGARSASLASVDDDDFWGSMSAAPVPAAIQPPPSIAPPTMSKPPPISSPPLPSLPSYRGLGASELPSAPQDNDGSGFFARPPGTLRSPPLPPITSLYGEYFDGSPTKSPPRKTAGQGTRQLASSELDNTRAVTPPVRTQILAPIMRPPSTSSSTQAIAPKIQLLPLSAASVRNSPTPVMNNNSHRRTDSEVDHAAAASLVATAAARQGTWPAPQMTSPSSGPAPTAPALAPPPGFRAPRTREAKDTDTAWGFDDDDDDDVPLGHRTISPPRPVTHANGSQGAARVMSPPLPPQPSFGLRPPPGSQPARAAPTAAAADLFDFGSDSFAAAPVTSPPKVGQGLSQGQSLTASDLSFFDNL